MVPVSHKKQSLKQVSDDGITSLFQQGGVVLVSFVVMLCLTGGAPSGLAVGLTVGFSGILVAWSEQHRLLKKAPVIETKEDFQINENVILTQRAGDHSIVVLDSLKNEIQSYLEQLEKKETNPNKLAIIRKKFAKTPLEIDVIKKLQPLINLILESQDDFLGLCKHAGLNPQIDFSNSKLSFAYLSGINLDSANLSDANLSCVNLSGANLNSANLSGADLMWANMSGTNLSGAVLRRTILSEANLNGAILNGAILYRAVLREVTLEGAFVRNALFFNCIGISPELKHELQSRGAIFEDFPGVEDKELVPR